MTLQSCRLGGRSSPPLAHRGGGGLAPLPDRGRVALPRQIFSPCVSPRYPVPLYTGTQQGDSMATEKLVQLKVLVTADLHRALKVYAAQSGEPMGDRKSV